MLKSTREKLIAASVIDYFLDNGRFSVKSIGTEIQFLDYRRRADIVLVTASQIVAIEIKSKTDRADRLLTQIPDYLRVFERVYVAIEEELPKHILSKIPDYVGILMFHEETQKTCLIRKAERHAETNKEYIKTSIPPTSLNKIIRDGRKKNPEKISISCASKTASAYLRKSTEQNFLEFKRIRGNATHTDDLILLSMRNFKKEIS